jgi:hypothetical protein
VARLEHPLTLEEVVTFYEIDQSLKIYSIPFILETKLEPSKTQKNQRLHPSSNNFHNLTQTALALPVPFYNNKHSLPPTKEEKKKRVYSAGVSTIAGAAAGAGAAVAISAANWALYCDKAKKSPVGPTSAVVASFKTNKPARTAPAATVPAMAAAPLVELPSASVLSREEPAT